MVRPSELLLQSQSAEASEPQTSTAAAPEVQMQSQNVLACVPEVPSQDAVASARMETAADGFSGEPPVKLLSGSGAPPAHAASPCCPGRGKGRGPTFSAVEPLVQADASLQEVPAPTAAERNGGPTEPMDYQGTKTSDDLLESSEMDAVSLEHPSVLDTAAVTRDPGFALHWLQHPTFELQSPGAGVSEKAAIRDFFLEQARMKETEILSFERTVRRRLELDGDGSCQFARQRLPRMSHECRRMLTRELDAAEAACLSARCPGSSPLSKPPTRSNLKAITKR